MRVISRRTVYVELTTSPVCSAGSGLSRYPAGAWNVRPGSSTVTLHDCGVQVNPLIVDGQVHGGVVQGLAQALYEEAVYDADGNLTNSTLAEYLVPAASDVRLPTWVRSGARRPLAAVPEIVWHIAQLVC